MKTKVSLKLQGMSVTELMGFAAHVVSKMTGNSNFPSPSPALARITTAVNELQDAYSQALGGGVAQTAAMHQKQTALELLLTAIGHHVEDIANDPANASAGAAAIILGAGMDEKPVRTRKKRGFDVQAGKHPGSTFLTAPYILNGLHEWAYTPDISKPDSWVDWGPTLQSSTTITGLESGKRYWFRHRVILKDGPTDYDDPISRMVP